MKKINVLLICFLLMISVGANADPPVTIEFIGDGFGDTVNTGGGGEWLEFDVHSLYETGSRFGVIGGHLNTYDDAEILSNATNRLVTSSTPYNRSGFILTNYPHYYTDPLNRGNPFDLISFDFSNGTVAGANTITSIELIGLLWNGDYLSKTYNSPTDTWTTYGSLTEWRDLQYVMFMAHGGQYNWAAWDKIVVNDAGVPGGDPVNPGSGTYGGSAPVPEPATMLLFGLGLLGLAGVNRRKQ